MLLTVRVLAPCASFHFGFPLIRPSATFSPARRRDFGCGYAALCYVSQRISKELRVALPPDGADDLAVDYDAGAMSRIFERVAVVER